MSLSGGVGASKREGDGGGLLDGVWWEGECGVARRDFEGRYIATDILR